MSDQQKSATPRTDYWWGRDDLQYRQQRLYLGQCDLIDLAHKIGTPAYVIRAPRVIDKLQRLHSAFDNVGLTHKIYYAIKANRSSRLLTYLAAQGLCGADL